MRPASSPDGHRVSIAMCTYNGASYVLAQLESFARQTRWPDELVVCDDASTDDTVDIVRAFAGRAPFKVRCLVNPQTLGFIRNFENCAQRCTGDIVFLSDQDDVWQPDKLQRFIDGFGADRAATLLFCDADLVDHALRPLGKTWWQAQGFGRRAQRALESAGGFGLMLKNPAWMAAGATSAYTAAHADAVFPIPPGWTHDAWISTVLSALGRVGLIRSPLNLYRQHAVQSYGATAPVSQLIRSGHSRGSSAAHFFDTAERYAQLAARLQQFASGDTAVQALIQRKIRHWRERGRVRQVSRAAGAGIALRELCRGNYHRFAQSWRSFAMDLVFVLGRRGR